MSTENEEIDSRDYFFDTDINEFIKPVNKELEFIDEEYKSIIDSFKYNLVSVAQSIGIPYRLYWRRASNYTFEKIYSSELVKNTPLVTDKIFGGEDYDEEEEKLKARKKALQISRKKFIEEFGNDEGKKRLNEITYEFLERSLEGEADLKDSSKELLRQGIVLSWSVFEVISRDFMEKFLNNNPSYFEKIGEKNIPTDLLKKYSYNISEHLGDIFVENVDWSNLSNIKSHYFRLFEENESLKKTLKSNSLWKISQRRHLIVHRRGEVDKHYIQKTDDDYPIGEKLPINSSIFLESLTVIRDSGIEIIKCANTS